MNFKQFTYKPVENQSDNVFSYEETQKLLSYLQGIYEPYSLAIQLSFYLFIRVGETKAIQWQDIDYKNRSVYLHRQVTCARILNDDLTLSKRQVTVAKQMKGNTSKGFRKQYLTDEALSILKKAKEINPNGIYIFEPNGSLMTTDSFNQKTKKILSVKQGFLIIQAIRFDFTMLLLPMTEKTLQRSATLWDIVRWKPQSIT